MNIFPYVPKVPVFQIPNLRDGGFVPATIDIIDQNGVRAGGVIEILTPTSGTFIGLKPAWSMPTANAPIGDSGEIDNLIVHVGEAKWQLAGSALTIINQEGSKLITDFPDEFQALIDSDPRFHVATVPPVTGSGGPPFTDEVVALAWLQTQVTLLKIVNGKVVLA